MRVIPVGMREGTAIRIRRMTNDDPIATTVKREMAICAAQLIGVLVFLGVSLVLRQQGINPDVDESVSILTYFAAGFGVALLFCGLVLPGQLANRIVRKTLLAVRGSGRLEAAAPTREFARDSALDAKLAAVHLQKSLIGFALLEAAALFNVVAHLLNGTLLSVMMVGVLLLAMAMQFPTADRVRKWIEMQKTEASEAAWQEGGS